MGTASLSAKACIALRTYCPLICITVIAALIRIFMLGSQSVWLDEAISLRIAMRPIKYAITFVDPTPPLYYIVLSAWYHIFHDSLLWAYLLSIFIGIALVIVMYFFVKRFFSHRAAIIASLLTAINAAFVYYSQEIRAYSLLFLLALLTLFAYLAFREAQTAHALTNKIIKTGILFAISAIALLYTHIYGAIIIFAMAIDYIVWRLWFAPTRKSSANNGNVATAKAATADAANTSNSKNSTSNCRAWIEALIVFGIIAISYIPWLIRLPKIIAQGNTSWIVSPNLWSLWYLVRSYIAGEIYSYFYVPVILLFVFVIIRAIIFQIRRINAHKYAHESDKACNKNARDSQDSNPTNGLHDARQFSLLFIALLVVLIPFTISLVTLPFFTTRYALVSLVFLIPIFALYLNAISQRTMRTIIIAIVVLTCIGATLVQSQIVLKDDWRSVSVIVKDANDAKVPTFVTPIYNAVALGYYVNATCLGNYDRDDLIYDCLATSNQLYAIPQLSAGLPFEPDSFLLVLDQRINTTSGDLFLDTIRENYTLTPIHTFLLHTSNSLPASIHHALDGDSDYQSGFSEIFVLRADRINEKS